jgi:hypothetical protein
MVPEELRPACHDSLLRGLALVERAADGSDGVVRPFRADQLPKVIQDPGLRRCLNHKHAKPQPPNPHPSPFTLQPKT